MTKSDDKRVPALRFKGFTDDWEQRKPGDFLVESKIIGHKGDKAKKLTVKLWGKGVQEKQDILSGSANTQYYIRKSGQLMYGKLDFLHAAFGIVPSQLNNYESTIDSPSFDVKSANSIFLLNLFLRKKFYLYYGERANGSRKAKRIHEKDFLVMPIKMPEINEQNKISNLIEIVNNRITLQQRKLERLKSLKKAYLRLIFNTSESIHYLKDIAEYRRGSFPQPYTKREWYGGKDSQPFVQVADVNTNLRLFSKTKETISKKAQQNSVFVPKHTIVVTLQGSIGRVAITQYDSYVDRTLLIITKLKKRIDKYYLAYALQEKFNIEKRKAPGGTIKTITKSTLSNFAIILPNFEKQSQQSQTLKTIDNEIYLINKKLDKLVQFKQFLLQNMFI